MPIIQADIRRRRTVQPRDELIRELARIVQEVTGAPLDTTSAAVREPSGPAAREG